MNTEGQDIGEDDVSSGIKLTLYIDSEESLEESIDILMGVVKFFDFKVEVDCTISRTRTI